MGIHQHSGVNGRWQGGVAGAIALRSLALPSLAQRASFFEQYRRPATVSTRTGEDCWMAAVASCSPVTYRTTTDISIAVADNVLELWGIQGQGCVTYSRVEQLWAFGQAVPDAQGMETLCVYTSAADLQLEWQIILGQRDGILGGQGGIVDPQTNVARTAKDIDGRQIAVCDIYMPQP